MHAPTAAARAAKKRVASSSGGDDVDGEVAQVGLAGADELGADDREAAGDGDNFAEGPAGAPRDFAVEGLHVPSMPAGAWAAKRLTRCGRRSRGAA
jgi:hypothetical protein